MNKIISEFCNKHDLKLKLIDGNIFVAGYVSERWSFRGLHGLNREEFLKSRTMYLWEFQVLESKEIVELRELEPIPMATQTLYLY